jgi:hypothetical protein
MCSGSRIRDLFACKDVAKRTYLRLDDFAVEIHFDDLGCPRGTVEASCPYPRKERIGHGWRRAIPMALQGWSRIPAISANLVDNALSTERIAAMARMIAEARCGLGIGSLVALTRLQDWFVRSDGYRPIRDFA